MPAVDSGRPAGAGPGLFDADAPVRSVANRPLGTPRAVRPRSSPILGTGPEISHHRRPGRSHHQPPFPTTAPVDLPTPSLERLIDSAYRWRTLLGLALAGLMTTAIVIAYQGPNGDDLEVVGDGAGAESRSAIAAVTEFDATQPTSASPTTTPRERQVQSEVDGEQPEAPAGPTRSSSTTSPSTSTSATPTSETIAPTTAGTTAEPTTAPSEIVPPESSSTATTVDPATTTTVADPTPSSSDASTPDPTQPTDTPSTTVDPSSTTTAPAPVRAEAEDGTLLGTARARSDHEGFSGTGFVGDLITEGSGVSLVVEAPGGPTPFQVRYSAGPDNGPAGPRTISVVVNETTVTEARMRLTPSWDEWDVVAGTIDLVPGENQIVLLWAPGDTGWVNIDFVELN